MLFGPSTALRITLDAIRVNPDHAEGILLGMLAAVEAFDAQLAEGLSEAAANLDDTQPSLGEAKASESEPNGARRRVDGLSRVT